jgi:hypothetical protein
MKVLCIDTRNPKHPHLLKPEHYIYQGETYNVCGHYFDKSDNYEYYYLVERQMKPLASYRAYRFVPLSEIDETAVLEEAVVPSSTIQVSFTIKTPAL